jgi:hypothetical protein
MITEFFFASAWISQYVMGDHTPQKPRFEHTFSIDAAIQ